MSLAVRRITVMQALRPFARSWPFWLCCVLLASPAWLGGWHSQLRPGDRTGSKLSVRLRAANWRTETPEEPPAPHRRLAAMALALTVSLGGLSSARALIQGNKPPEGYGLGKGLSKAAKLDCRSRAECEELGLQREQEKYGDPNSQEKTYKLTASGARYKDMKEGNKPDGVAKVGDDLKIRYRVMRSGKRSYDGLSGEATTLFSLGYGEDDGPKDATLNAPIGQGRFVKALDEGLVGMAVGGVRRVQVRPDYGLGWKKEGKCAEAISAVGMVAGLPAAGAERESACIDTSLLPQPIDWDAKRRFERRFDEGLIVEVELMGLGK